MIPKNIQAIIFDLDGTTVDTEALWALAAKQIIESRGILFSENIRSALAKNIRGCATLQACEKIKHMFDLADSAEDLAREKISLVYSHMKGNVRFVQGFLPFFKHVQNLGLKTALVTNSTDQFVELIDQEVNLKKLFGSHIYGPGDIRYLYKPLPDVYLYATNRLDVAANACVAIEDSATGITSAVSAGIFCIALNTGHNRTDLKESNLIVDSYAEIHLDALNSERG